MDSSHILQLVGALLGIALTVSSYIGHYLLGLGEQALNNPWTEETYQKILTISQSLPTDPSIASTTEFLETQLPLSPSETPIVQPIAATSAAPTTSNAPASPTTSNASSPPGQTNTPNPPSAPTPVTQPVTQDPSGLPSPFNSILDSTQDAVVNILCTSQNGNLITVTTGSGVIIDPKGIILTNSHVAQDLLFTDPSRPPLNDCTIRQGHISSSLYKVSVLYIPLSWAEANQGIDDNKNPEGTGEGDYALLAITKSATGDSLPSSFPFISPVTSYHNLEGEKVLAIGYPAEDVQGNLQAGVPLKYALTNIKTSFALPGDNNGDILQTDPNAVAERGSSGGALVDMSGNLIGLIFSVQNPSIADGSEDLQAINLAYIFKEFSAEGISLSAIDTNPAAIAANFASTGLTIRNLVDACPATESKNC